MIFFDNTYGDELAASIAGAEKEIDIAMYVWRRTDESPTLNLTKIITELLRARARGVRVRVLTDFAGSAAYLRNVGIEAVAIETGRTLHSKLCIIDSRCVYVGSHNMTKRSLNSNWEATARLDDYESVAQAKTYYNMIWDSYAGS